MAKKATAESVVEKAISGRTLEYIPLSRVSGAKRNPKLHAVSDINASMGRFGFTEPIMLDERTGLLVAGHGRLETLASMREAKKSPPEGIQIDDDGEWMVPVIRGWSSRSDADAEAYILASNQLTTKGGWDDAALATMLQELGAADALDGTGFGEEDLRALLSEVAKEELPAGPVPGEDDAPDPPSETYVKLGDLYALGKHRILCGDCRSFADVKRLLAGARINVAVTSPPYASQRTYDETSGFKPIPPDEYVEWYRDVAANIMANLADDGSYFCNIKEHCEDGQRSLYVKDLTLAHVREWGWRFVDEFCWTRPGPPGSWPNRFKNSWEPVFHFSTSAEIRFRPTAVSRIDDTAYRGNGGTNMLADGSQHEGESFRGKVLPSNVLSASGVDSTGHPAAYPVALPEFFVKAFSDPGDVVFDPFMGSGTTLIAAEKNGRVAFGTEISPRYVQVIVERWEKFTGKKAARHE